MSFLSNEASHGGGIGPTGYTGYTGPGNFTGYTGPIGPTEPAGGGGGGTWGSITGTLSAQTDLQNTLDAKMNLNSKNTIPYDGDIASIFVN